MREGGTDRERERERERESFSGSWGVGGGGEGGGSPTSSKPQLCSLALACPSRKTNSGAV